MHSTRVAILAPYQKAMDVCFSGPKKMDLTISTEQDLKDGICKLNSMQLTQLHITIMETGDNDIAEISQLYEYSKMVRIGNHPLEYFSVTYSAENSDDNYNSARFMILSNFLNQLNWGLCVSTDIILHMNYVENDPRLELFDELPVNISICGNTGCSAPVAAEDRVKLNLIERSYLYLEGYL